MLGKQKTRKVRKNRLKKDKGRTQRLWVQRAGAALKLTALIAALLAVSAIFMLGYAAVTQSDYFRTRSVEVVGNQRLSKAEIMGQALKPGDNLMALNLRVMRERLLAHPWISDAQVSRVIPETIVIEVEEQQPLAVLDLGRKFLLNIRGRIFKEQTDGDPADLPLITGLAYGDISLADDPLSPAMSEVMQLLDISRTAGSAIAYDTIAGLEVDEALGITLTVAPHGRRIKMGFGRYKEKNRRLSQLLPFLEGSAQWRGFVALDANNPDRIVVQLGTAARAGA